MHFLKVMAAKYSKEERTAIGKAVYEKQISINAAAEKYGINPYTVRDYYRQYKAQAEEDKPLRYSSYAKLSKDELINEIMTLRVKLILKDGKKPVEAVHELKDEFPVRTLCDVAGITSVWYYTWLRRKSST